MAVAIETPAVVRALQLAGVVDAPLGERHQPVGTDIFKGLPTVSGTVPPEHQVFAQQGEGPGPGAIQVPQEGHGVPLVGPGDGSCLGCGLLEGKGCHGAILAGGCSARVRVAASGAPHGFSCRGWGAGPRKRV